MDIEYRGNELVLTQSEEDWLGPNMPNGPWHVYYRPWSAGDVEREEEIDGNARLSDVINIIDRQFEEEYTPETIPYVTISPEPVLEFYPRVRQDNPLSLVFFDGGAWYWTESCERVSLH